MGSPQLIDILVIWSGVGNQINAGDLHLSSENFEAIIYIINYVNMCAYCFDFFKVYIHSFFGEDFYPRID